MRIVPGGLLAKLAQPFHFAAYLVEMRADRAQQALACFSGGYASGRTRKEAHSDAFLQLADGVAER